MAILFRELGIRISPAKWMLYLSPPFAVRLFPFIAAVSAVGEVPLELWLIVVGLDETRWREQASGAGAYTCI
jgi:hypothetical protein